MGCRLKDFKYKGKLRFRLADDKYLRYTEDELILADTNPVRHNKHVLQEIIGRLYLPMSTTPLRPLDCHQT
eukprot:7320397-Pyramimonas_sp.AAC.2